MAQLYDLLKKTITPEMLADSAVTLSEDQKKVESGAGILLPALLGRFIKQGDTPRTAGVLKEAGKTNLLADLGEVFKGHGVIKGMNLGERMENALLGKKESGFIAKVAAHSGLKKESADRLSGWVSAAIAALLGNRMVKDKVSLATIIGELDKERATIDADVPADVAAALGLAPAAKKEPAKAAPAPAKKKSKWWLWLLLVLVLLALICLWWRSCNGGSCSRGNSVVEEVAVVATAPAVEHVDVALPSGKIIKGFNNGCEQCMVNYLNSDAYKNASAADLEKIWFEFDGIDFEHDSAIELMAGSEKQLDNIVHILKEYPDTKVRIGGFADKTGGEEINDEISRLRAVFIANYFEKAGIEPARLSTEGFGKDYAVVAANAPDSQRASDRDIALRFVK